MVWAKLATVATAFGQTTVRRDGTVPDRLTRAWTAAQDHLPDGWALDGLRCASSGLSAESGSDDWVALAVGPTGEQRSHQAADAVSALEGLAESFDPD
jgi:hypothetical protein